MKKYSYFDVPTQVQFWNYTYGRYHGGIAYRDEIIFICGCYLKPTCWKTAWLK